MVGCAPPCIRLCNLLIKVTHFTFPDVHVLIVGKSVIYVCREVPPQGEVTHIGAVQIATTGVKMWSSKVEGCGQMVKRPLSPSVLYSEQSKYSFDELLAHAQYVWVKGSRTHKSGVVKRSRLIFGRSRILTPVAAICTAPICVTPLAPVSH